MHGGGVNQVYRAALELARSELESLNGLYAVDVAGENEPFRIDTSDVISIVDSVLNNNLTQERFAPVRPGVLRRMLGRLRRLFGCRSYIEFRLTRRT